MKYAISMILGILTGATLFCLLLYFNPFASGASISPLAMSRSQVINLSFPMVASETLAITNDGESAPPPYPKKILQLWERAVKEASATIVILDDSRGEPVGIGVKFQSDSEDTSILDAQVLVNSVWHIHLPGRGTMLVDQSENHWSYLRDIIIPAHRSSGDNWRGTWLGNITAGPGALGTAMVAGGSGQFDAMDSIAVEALSAKAYSVANGPVAVTGELSIELPPGEDSLLQQDQVSDQVPDQ
jgi:hypothetical protein